MLRHRFLSWWTRSGFCSLKCCVSWKHDLFTNNTIICVLCIQIIIYDNLFCKQHYAVLKYLKKKPSMTNELEKNKYCFLTDEKISIINILFIFQFFFLWNRIDRNYVIYDYYIIWSTIRKQNYNRQIDK